MGLHEKCLVGMIRIILSHGKSPLLVVKCSFCYCFLLLRFLFLLMLIYSVTTTTAFPHFYYCFSWSIHYFATVECHESLD